MTIRELSQGQTATATLRQSLRGHLQAFSSIMVLDIQRFGELVISYLWIIHYDIDNCDRRMRGSEV